jgi:hypothetical protein
MATRKRVDHPGANPTLPTGLYLYHARPCRENGLFAVRSYVPFRYARYYRTPGDHADRYRFSGSRLYARTPGTLCPLPEYRVRKAQDNALDCPASYSLLPESHFPLAPFRVHLYPHMLAIRLPGHHQIWRAEGGVDGLLAYYALQPLCKGGARPGALNLPPGIDDQHRAGGIAQDIFHPRTEVQSFGTGPHIGAKNNQVYIGTPGRFNDH